MSHHLPPPEAMMAPAFLKHLKVVEKGMVDATFNEGSFDDENSRHDFETHTLPW